MSTRYALSRASVLYRSPAGGWIWDDFVDHHKYALSVDALRVLDAAHGTTVDDVITDPPAGVDGTTAASVLESAIRNGILLPIDDPARAQEEDLLDNWSEYGHVAAAYHFATRTMMATPFVNLDDDTSRLVAKTDQAPPPPPFFEVPHGIYVPLPAPDPTDLAGVTLSDVLRARKTVRDFRASALSDRTLSALLQVCCRPVRRPGQDHLVLKPLNSYFKVVPSGGARHPTEWFLNVLAVQGLDPGAYHYNPGTHALCRLGDPLHGEQLKQAAGDQGWVADGALQILFASHTPRNRWKYEMARAYRVLNLDVGHISQAVFMVAAALDIDVAFIGSFRDEWWEHVFSLDPATQLVMGLMILGPSPNYVP